MAPLSERLDADSSLARQSYQKLRAACRQRAWLGLGLGLGSGSGSGFGLGLGLGLTLTLTLTRTLASAP